MVEQHRDGPGREPAGRRGTHDLGLVDRAQQPGEKRGKAGVVGNRRGLDETGAGAVLGVVGERGANGR
ncbi:MAG: hypothetical protein FJW96_05355 [Actinobacteria bacterium]|nr:hypothetical protein [Actinomycetota bacterium]